MNIRNFEEVDIRNFIAHWSQAKFKTNSHFTISHSVTKNEPKWMQFVKGKKQQQSQGQITAVLEIKSVSFQSVGVGKNQKIAKENAAKDMVRFLILSDKMKPEELKNVIGGEELLRELKAGSGNQKKEDQETQDITPEKQSVPPVSRKRVHSPELAFGDEIVFYGNIKRSRLTDSALQTNKEEKTEINGANDSAYESHAGSPDESKPSTSSRGEIVDLTDDVEEEAVGHYVQNPKDAVVAKRVQVGSQESHRLVIHNNNGPRNLLGSGLDPTTSAQRFVESVTREHSRKIALLSDDIIKHYKVNGQDEEVYQWKMSIRRQLFSEISNGLQHECYLFATGSTINGCGSYNSDMDLCLVVPHSFEGTDTNRRYALDILRRTRTILRRSRNLRIVDGIELIMAKVPILRLRVQGDERMKIDSLEIDMNCNNVAGIYNSHLMHYYSLRDRRFPALCLYVKHWAIRAGINDASTGTLNSYSIILLILHFLQAGTVPSVMPNLQLAFPERFQGFGDLRDLNLFETLPPLPNQFPNNQSPGELLAGFFAYYNAFDFHREAISIRQSCRFPRAQAMFDTDNYQLYIEEPFDGQNTARCVFNPEKMRKIQTAIREAHACIRNNPSSVGLRVTI